MFSEFRFSFQEMDVLIFSGFLTAHIYIWYDFFKMANCKKPEIDPLEFLRYIFYRFKDITHCIYGVGPRKVRLGDGLFLKRYFIGLFHKYSKRYNITVWQLGLAVVVGYGLATTVKN